MIRTFAAIVFVALTIVFVLPFLILWTWIAGSPDFMYSVAISGLRAANRLAGIHLRVEGVENIPTGVCIFASNHVSNVDPPAIVTAIPRRVSLLAKKEVFRIPILATALRQAHFVPVDREDREAAAGAVDLAVRYLKEGDSFAVYPEGTRSRDGRLRSFKRGTFVIAIEAGVPVVPVSMSGTQRLMRKGSRAIQPGEVIVRFGPAVDASQYTMERRGELLARVEALVAAGLAEDQQPLTSGNDGRPGSTC